MMTKGKTDKEQAEDFRKRFNSMALPIVGLVQEMTRKGYGCEFQIRLTADGKPDLKFEVTKKL